MSDRRTKSPMMAIASIVKSVDRARVRYRRHPPFVAAERRNGLARSAPSASPLSYFPKPLGSGRFAPLVYAANASRMSSACVVPAFPPFGEEPERYRNQDRRWSSSRHTGCHIWHSGLGETRLPQADPRPKLSSAAASSSNVCSTESILVMLSTRRTGASGFSSFSAPAFFTAWQ